MGRGRFAEHLHAVGDRLNPRHRRTTGTERPENQEQPQRFQGRDRGRRIGAKAVVKHQVMEPQQGEQGQHHHEGVGRHRKQAPRLAQTAQIGPTHQGQQQQGQRHLMGQQRRQQRTDRLTTGHQAHSRCEHVINQQGRCRHQAHVAAQVVARHHIGAAPIGVGSDHLAIRQHHHGDQSDDRQGDRQ